MTATITCKKCGKTKPLKSYYPSNKSTCIACILKSGLAYRKAQGKPHGGRRAQLAKGLKHIPAPCGRDMIPRGFGRCAEFMACGCYEDCLIEAAKENWTGWKCVEREVKNVGEISLDGDRSSAAGSAGSNR